MALAANHPWAPTAQAIAHDGPFIATARAAWRRIRMTKDIRFALVRQPTDPLCKPQVFPTLATLALAIQTERVNTGLQAFDAPVFVFGEDEPRQGVSLFLTDGDSADYLGWAYLDGQGLRALRTALDACQPDIPTLGRAA